MNQKELNKVVSDHYIMMVEKGFYGKEFNINSSIMGIVSELGETYEAYRRGWSHFSEKIYVEKPRLEEWRPVPSCTDYLVSSKGRVRSLDMKVWNGKVHYKKEGRVLSPGLCKTGYYTVALRGKTHKVCWLVAEAFIGFREKGFVVNHKNGDKTCDWLTNLEVVTQSENCRHAIRTGLTNKKKKLTLDDQFKIAFRLKNGESPVVIQKDFKQVSTSAIKSMKQRGHEIFTDCFELELADSILYILGLSRHLGIPVLIKKDQWFSSGWGNGIGSELLMITNQLLNKDFQFSVNLLFGFCKYHNIDIDKYIYLKMAFNKTRPIKNGKEF